MCIERKIDEVLAHVNVLDPVADPKEAETLAEQARRGEYVSREGKHYPAFLGRTHTERLMYGRIR